MKAGVKVTQMLLIPLIALHTLLYSPCCFPGFCAPLPNYRAEHLKSALNNYSWTQLNTIIRKKIK